MTELVLTINFAQSAQMMIASLCAELYMKIKLFWPPEQCRHYLIKMHYVAILLPATLMVVSYLLDGDDLASPSYALNKIRYVPVTQIQCAPKALKPM
jgi:hypothetical protein